MDDDLENLTYIFDLQRIFHLKIVLLQHLTVGFYRISTLFDQFLSSEHIYVPAGDSIRN